MPIKLSWEQIRKEYDQEWVELIDYDWDFSFPDPTAGVVRSHAKTRKELSKQVRQDPVEDSAIVFVGDWRLPENMVLNVNNHRLEYSK